MDNKRFSNPPYEATLRPESLLAWCLKYFIKTVNSADVAVESRAELVEPCRQHVLTLLAVFGVPHKLVVRCHAAEGRQLQVELRPHELTARVSSDGAHYLDIPGWEQIP